MATFTQNALRKYEKRMEDLPELGFSKKTRFSGDFSDLERTLIQEDVDTYSRNMDRLFAEDEKINASPSPMFGSVSSSQGSSQIEERREPTTTKNRTYFSSAAFWKRKSDSLKVGVILTKLVQDEKLYFLMYDANKVILEKQLVDDIEFKFSKSDFGVRLDSKSGDTEKEPIEVKFVDFSTFLRFGVTALIRSNNQSCFKLSDGSGDVDIDKNCDIRYNITDHSLDEEDGMRLPNERKGVKTRLSEEKITEHVIYKWLGGLQKGCHLLIKTSDRSVHDIIVDKIRKPVDPVSSLHSDSNDRDESNAVNYVKNDTIVKDQENTLVIEENITREYECPESQHVISDDMIIPKKSVGIDRTSTSPLPLLVDSSSSCSEQQPPTQTVSTEDIRDLLHRIVGIELDRIEMRLNARLDRFQDNVNSRLDQQTEILEKILNNCSSR
ncbi:unnamed protein product [Caenorhabditis brenneri]